jgi:hypothetical protein
MNKQTNGGGLWCQITKRTLIALYCRGLLNARIVAWFFATFDLRSA